MAYPFDRQPEEMQGAESGPQFEQSLGQSMGGRPTEAGREDFEPPASTPPIDVYDSEEEIRVFVDLPGFEEDDISIQGDETNLVVSAKRNQDTEEDVSPLIQERARVIERTIPLHAPVDVSEATARYKNGVCEVVLPKTVAEQYREITLRTG